MLFHLMQDLSCRDIIVYTQLTSHTCQFLTIVNTIHSFGICHADLHVGNILVTSDGQMFASDFAGAKLESSAEERTAERDHVSMLLSFAGSCHK